MSGNDLHSNCGSILVTHTAASMQTTHSELPGPPTGLGAEGVTGVPGVTGELGAWEPVALGSRGGANGGEAMGTDAASSFFEDAVARKSEYS